MERGSRAGRGEGTPGGSDLGRDDLGQSDLGEVDLLARRYLQDANGDALSALRQALADALRDGIDARLRILELERAASSGYRRRPAGRTAGEGARAPG